MSYDSVGRCTWIARYESLTTTNAVAASDFVYDNAGRLTSLQHVGQVSSLPSSTSIARYTYTWDTADRLRSMNFDNDHHGAV